MFNIIKNTWKLFSRDKEYFSMILFEPIMMLLMFSFLLSFQNRISISVANLDQGPLGEKIVAKLKQQDYTMVHNTSKDDVKKNVVDGSSEIGIIIGKDTSKMATANDTESIQTVQLAKAPNAALINSLIASSVAEFQGKVATNTPVTINKVKKKGIAISASLGFLIFKLITSGSILGQLIMKDRKSGVRGRIFLSNTSSFSYLMGLVVVFLTNALFSILSYIICALIFRFDFGMEHPLQMIPILFCASILSSALYTFISAFLNNSQLLWYIAVLIFLPTSILSGALVPFAKMPELMQRIGSFLPQRWLCQAVENLQQGMHFSAAALPIIGVLLFSLLLFIIGSWRLKSPATLQS